MRGVRCPANGGEASRARYSGLKRRLLLCMHAFPNSAFATCKKRCTHVQMRQPSRYAGKQPPQLGNYHCETTPSARAEEPLRHLASKSRPDTIWPSYSGVRRAPGPLPNSRGHSLIMVKPSVNDKKAGGRAGRPGWFRLWGWRDIPQCVRPPVPTHLPAPGLMSHKGPEHESRLAPGSHAVLRPLIPRMPRTSARCCPPSPPADCCARGRFPPAGQSVLAIRRPTAGAAPPPRPA